MHKSDIFVPYSDLDTYQPTIQIPYGKAFPSRGLACRALASVRVHTNCRDAGHEHLLLIDLCEFHLGESGLELADDPFPFIESLLGAFVVVQRPLVHSDVQVVAPLGVLHVNV